MIFWDEAKIMVKAGKGGDGLASFRRQKFVPRGGPDGGDGGNGGDVIFRVDPNLNTLVNYNRLKKFAAQDGEKGKKEKCHGKNGEDLILDIPQGTIVYELKKEKDLKGKKVLDLSNKSQSALIVKGGKGGWGNCHFATSIQQAPRRANPGKPGGKKWLKLELKSIADVGIIGLPNSGKSTLLARISAAKPKIADYEFTTIIPNLGVVKIGKFSFVACDIPGLIEGASRGKGLGDKFLRHVERTKILVHIIDINSKSLIRDYKTIQKELEDFSPASPVRFGSARRAGRSTLLSKKEIVVVNKIDTLVPEKVSQKIKKLQEKINDKIIPISAVSGENIDKLLYKIVDELKN